MRPVRVLVGSLPAPLRNALVEAMSSLADLEVVDVAAQPTTILAAAGTVRADVVVLAAVDGGLPGVASHLLDQYPDLWLVAVTADGQRALVAAKRPQVEEVAIPSLAELVRTIRSAGEQPAPWPDHERGESMPVTITSLVASGPVLVPLSTGTTLRLSPGEVSDELPDVEVANNAKVEKLQRQGLIAVLGPESGTDAAAAEEPAEQQDGPRAAGRSRTRSRARSEPSG